LTYNVRCLDFQWIYFYYTKLCVSDLNYRNETRNQSISDILQAAELPFLRLLQDTDKKSKKNTVLRKNKSLINMQIIKAHQATKKSRILRSTMKMKLLNNELVVSV